MTLREIFSGIGSYFNKAASGVLDFDLTPLIIIFLSIGIVYFHFLFVQEIYLNFKKWDTLKKIGMTTSFLICFTMLIALPIWLIFF